MYSQGCRLGTRATVGLQAGCRQVRLCPEHLTTRLLIGPDRLEIEGHPDLRSELREVRQRGVAVPGLRALPRELGAKLHSL